MSEDRTEEDTAFDAEQLAALARPSLPPTREHDDDDDDDDGPLDLKALTASMAPSSPSDEPDDDDGDSRVSMASGAASTSGDSSAKSAGSKSAKGKSAKGKSAKGKSAKGKSSGKSAEKTDEKTEEKKAVVAVLPAEEAASGGSGKMLIGLIALLGIGGVAFALTQNPEPEEQAALYPPSETTTTHNEPEPLEERTPEETPEPPVEEVVEAVPEVPEGENEALAAPEDEGTPAVAAAAPTGERRTRRRETTSAATTMETAETTEAATMEAAVEPSMEAETMAAEPTMEQSTSMDDMDDLLTRALGGTPTAGGTMTEATMEVAMEDRSSLPETPSRAAVTRALGGLMARMRRCAGDQVGMATARLRVNNNGQVISANIGGSPFGGTPQGACMEGVVQTARFPRFQRTHFDVTYPFSIRAIR